MFYNTNENTEKFRNLFNKSVTPSGQELHLMQAGLEALVDNPVRGKNVIVSGRTAVAGQKAFAYKNTYPGSFKNETKACGSLESKNQSIAIILKKIIYIIFICFKFYF